MDPLVADSGILFKIAVTVRISIEQILPHGAQPPLPRRLLAGSDAWQQGKTTETQGVVVRVRYFHTKKVGFQKISGILPRISSLGSDRRGDIVTPAKKA